MDLLPGERKRLDDIEGILRAEMSRVASMFDIFTRLERDDDKPPARGSSGRVAPGARRPLPATARAGAATSSSRYFWQHQSRSSSWN
jgi:hypothetical protein